MSRLPTAKQKTELYNRYAKSYERRTDGFKAFLELDYQIFLDNLMGKKIADLGSGPGRDCEVFRDKGFQPTAIDISDEMLKLCAAKGIPTLKMDLEKLNMPSGVYDGIWSYTAFTTIPKPKTYKILNSLADILSVDGCLFLGLIEGEKQGWKPADNKYDLPRYISRYSAEEVIAKMSARFQLLYFRSLDKVATGRNTYLNFLWRVK